jgi:flavin-dependent dehydrogenase
MESKLHDVIIVGAGLGGLIAANELAKKGYDVIVLERNKSPDKLDHPCGCMIGPVKDHITFLNKESAIEFKEIGLDISKEVVIAKPRKMTFFMPDGTSFGMSITKPFEKTMIFQINKENLRKELAFRAINSGAKIQFGVNVVDLLKENN